EEIAFHIVGNGAAEPEEDDMHHQFRQGVDAGGAVEVSRLGDEILALKLNLRIVFLELVEIMPVSGGRLAIEQSRLSDETDTGTAPGDRRSALVLGFEPGRVSGVVSNGTPRVAPLPWNMDQVELGRVLHCRGGGESEA